MTADPARGAWANAARRGVAAGRASVLPATLIWGAALVVVLGYYFHGGVRAALGTLTEWRSAVGVGFAVGSTALFGGILPLGFQYLQRADAKRESWRHLPFFVLFWGIKGAELHGLYALQAWLFGADPEPLVVVVKVAADQLIYAPVWAAPSFLVAYQWKDCGFSAAALRAKLGREWIRDVLLPVLLMNWVIWVPAVALIYCLPVALQLPLQNLVLCLGVLVATLLTKPPAEMEQATAVPAP
jgi:hypothetical protein